MKQEMRDILGRQYTITSNKSKRTYTIVRDGSKYRTYQMNKEEFEHADYWTGDDWMNFLKTDNYYVVY